MSAAPPGASAAPRPLRFRVRRGLDLPVPGAAPAGPVEEGPPIGSVALLGDDAPGVRAEPCVGVGDRVRAGQVLFRDRARPALRFTAPGAGVVVEVRRGPRRRIEAVRIRLEGDDEETFPPLDPDALSGEAVRERMQASGLWTALRTRPFGRIPDPDASPDALCVTALESDPLAAPAEPQLAARAHDFALGVRALATLTQGSLAVCVRPGGCPPLPSLPGLVVAEFEGPHPAGLPGTHLHRLAPVGLERRAWVIGHPDVIALGALLARGRIESHRVVALTGPGMRHPRLVRTRLGASTEDLVRDALAPGPCRVISGSLLSGRRASGGDAFLGRLHRQVCALPEATAPRARGWIAPGRGGRARRVFAGLGGGPLTTSLGGRPGAFFPLERMERVAPLDLPLTPLLRALVVGDLDAVRRLGGLELEPEDLALASFLCPGKIEYGRLLRSALDQIERQET